MPLILAATDSGCRTFTATGENCVELTNRRVVALCAEPNGNCLAVIDENEIWRRSESGSWSNLATSPFPLQSIVSINGTIFGGSTTDARMIRILPNKSAEQLPGFDNVPFRNKWARGGPTPIHVRSMTATCDANAILAAVHVGGIPRSIDGGEAWTPTLPIEFDVHEVQAHPTLPNVVAAASAIGLCMSYDAGRKWKVISEGLEIKNSLAVAVTQDEALFSIEDGPFAKCSQIWRLPISGGPLEQVREGLPPWLEGKVDTANIAANNNQIAVLDHGGNLYFSNTGSRDWKRIATGLPYVYGVLVGD